MSLFNGLEFLLLVEIAAASCTQNFITASSPCLPTIAVN
jgi:hypothetical protein